ncbi:hydroxyacid dehydrogenase [Polaribacter vadi]|jgi:D-lactate dehydrogenase|uniref:Hydroxyacid dehydrogenase n=1 Tax=Polaribacter vadi TaxID=1774273 RepID=A0A1B8TP41_9FLAO|nr:2-hydroxyacid dehydrogenase [Polaribacter vadi]AOW19161.1 hydroxyacid dehydrogenase [Polaribacter vadi]OBY61410.1 hydroxyacid dehydrogenase [Polaribacter vadi]
MNLAVFSTKPYDKEYFEKFKNEYDIKISYYEANLKPNTAKLTKDFDAVCVFVNDVLNKKTVETIAKKGVRLIALRCAGFNNVDLNACKENNIKVVRVPAYSPEAVAEHAMALILTLNRKTHKAYNRVREGNFSLTNLIGFNLYKKVVGVVGTGKIGAAFCRIAKGFGCEVLAYDINKNEELEKNGVKYVSLEELFNKSDVISLHCPLNEKTKHIIDKSSIEKMKKGVLLVNTSRGALVNTKDVITGLKSKKIAFLGIDVYEQEENLFFKDLSESIIKDDLLLRLNSFPNVLITSHQAFFTKEAMTEITTTTLNNIQEFMNDEKLTNEVS